VPAGHPRLIKAAKAFFEAQIGIKIDENTQITVGAGA
jgi:aspartate/methionine/tyrosine aminotransferase